MRVGIKGKNGISSHTKPLVTSCPTNSINIITVEAALHLPFPLSTSLLSFLLSHLLLLSCPSPFPFPSSSSIFIVPLTIRKPLDPYSTLGFATWANLWTFIVTWPKMNKWFLSLKCLVLESDLEQLVTFPRGQIVRSKA